MRYTLPGKGLFLLHIMVMAPISIAYGNIDGGAWIPPVLYLSGALCMWLFSIPGTKRGLIWNAWGFSHQMRMLRKHGFEHWGHAQRQDWDRYGRHARLLLHALCLLVTLLFLVPGKIGSDWFWQSILLGTSFALGVEIGFAAFKTGDETQRPQSSRFPRRISPPGPPSS